jgi:hypothetical protein
MAPTPNNGSNFLDFKSQQQQQENLFKNQGRNK